MKETTVNSLVVARTLFEKASGLCASDDRHLASAGLVVLQDALEVAFYALLIERGRLTFRLFSVVRFGAGASDADAEHDG